MRAVCYSRVSSAAQRERQTIDSQLRELPAFVARMGWTLAEPVTTYVDDGRTARDGHLEDREAFSRLMRDATARRFEVVAVVDMDRLTRSEDMAERGQVLGAFQRAGVQLAVSATGQVLDLASGEGDLLAQLGAFFSAEANRKHRERIKRGKLEAIHRGRKPAGPTPYGYAYDRATGLWSTREDQTAIVREVSARVAASESCEAIARDLNMRGVPRPRGGEWRRENVWKMARDLTYAGRWTADKAKGLSVAVPAILSAEQIAAADHALEWPAVRGIPRSKHVYLCERLAVCAICGARTVILTGTATRAAYYWCSNRRRPRGSDPKCTLPMFRVQDVDSRLWVALSDLLVRPDAVAQAIAERADDGQEADAWGADLKTAEARVARLEGAAKGALARHRRGLLSDLVLDAELEANAKERAMAERQAVAARTRLGGLAAARGRVRELGDAVAHLRAQARATGPLQRREVVRALLDGRDHAVVLGPGAGEVVAFARLGERAKDIPQALRAAYSSERLTNATEGVSLRLVVK